MNPPEPVARLPDGLGEELHQRGGFLPGILLQRRDVTLPRDRELVGQVPPSSAALLPS